MIKRTFDLIFAMLFLFLALVPMSVIAMLIIIDSKGSVIHKSKRVGKNNKIFNMYKFRTMKITTPNLATHKLLKPQLYITCFGKILRKYSLDEIPQFFNVILGNMSIVGPRPALFNQYDLIKLRTKKKIHFLTPGVTGWAQINGRDNISINKKVHLDEFYKKNQSIFFDFFIICLTLFNISKKKDISH